PPSIRTTSRPSAMLTSLRNCHRPGGSVVPANARGRRLPTTLFSGAISPGGEPHQLTARRFCEIDRPKELQLAEHRAQLLAHLAAHGGVLRPSHRVPNARVRMPRQVVQEL